MTNRFLWDPAEDIVVTHAEEKSGTSEGAIKGWETRRHGGARWELDADKPPRPEYDAEDIYGVSDKQNDDVDERVQSLRIRDVPGYDWYAHKTNHLWQQMTDEQVHAVDVYTSDYYEYVNGALRGTFREQDGMPGHLAYEEIVTETVKGMDEAFAAVEPLDEPIKVLRGLTSENVVAQLAANVGRTFVDKGYTSTTISSGAARAFYSTALLSIKLPAGLKVLPGSTAEEELILPRGSRFKVLSFDAEKKRGELELILDDRR